MRSAMSAAGGTVVSARSRILRVAAELFAERGYHGTGMSQIEEAVGLGRGALYHHIGSKEQLLFEIARDRPAALLEEVRTAATAGAEPETRFRRMAALTLRSFADHRPDWLVHLREHRFLTGARLVTVTQLRRDYEQLWRSVVDEAADRCRRPADVTVAANGILGMLVATPLWMTANGSHSPESVAELYCDVVLDGLRRRAAPAGT